MVLEFLLTSPEFDSSLCSRCAKLQVCVWGGVLAVKNTHFHGQHFHISYEI
jgi:hypothetical protein